MIRILSEAAPWIWIPDRSWLRERPGVVVIAFAHAVVASALILQGRGLPYVMDNNETFASFNHAANLWNFDFFRSWGLTDEALSSDPSAHPFVHTHQGNFPRIFSFLLYALGARGVEAQIWITALTVGTASVLMAHAFLRRLAGELFATVAVLLLITNYLLFAQWQINTYRVWHGLLLFAAFNSVHGYGLWRARQWMLATGSIYLALFYWELVFAAFTAIAVALYAAWWHRRDLRSLLRVWAVQCAGAALGLAVLIGQLVMFLGWQDFVTDLRLTFTARNHAPDDAQFLSELINFYGNKNIVFFYNLQSATSFGGTLAFARSLFRHTLQVVTPLLSLIAIAFAAAALSSDSRHPGPRDSAVAWPIVSFAATACLMPGTLLVLFAVLGGGDAVRGLRWSGVDGGHVMLGAFALLMLALATILAAGLRTLAAAISVSGTPPGIARSSRAGLFLLGSALIIFIQGDLYDPAVTGLWLQSFAAVPTWLARMAVLTALLASAIVILTGRRAALGQWHHVPSSVAPFLACGLLAYAAVYVLSSGYLHTGYLLRLCPLPVFHLNALLALGLFTTLALARTLAHASDGRSRAGARATALVVAVIGIGFIVCWIAVQTAYARRLPADRLAFISRLEHPDFRGRGVVSNTYAAPFGLVARTWAYGFLTHPEILQGGKLEGNGSTAHSYLWLADRNQSTDYPRPDLYVCFASLPTLPALVQELREDSETMKRCSRLPIVHRAIDGSHHAAAPSASVLARDPIEDRWAILRLKWSQ